MHVSCGYVVMVRDKYIDVLVREQRVSSNRLIRNLGRTRSDFSVGSDCLNEVKAGPYRNQLSKYAESSAVGLPGASNWTALLCEGVV